MALVLPSFTLNKPKLILPGTIGAKKTLFENEVPEAKKEIPTLGVLPMATGMKTTIAPIVGGDIIMPVLERAATMFLDTFAPVVRPTVEKYIQGKPLITAYKESYKELDDIQKSKEVEVNQKIKTAKSQGASSWELAKIQQESPTFQFAMNSVIGFVGGIKFVGKEEAQNIITQAIKSKITRKDLQDITAGVMKDNAKLEAYKTMTTNPEMRKELSQIARNDKLPITQQISDYLKTKLTSSDLSSFKLKTEVSAKPKQPLKLPGGTLKLAPQAQKATQQAITAEKGIIPKVKVAEEFKVGDILDPQGKTNMVGKVKIRKIEGNSLYFTDANGTDYSGISRSVVRNLIKGGSWKKVSQAIDKPTIPKELEPLAVETRKYGSEEEFEQFLTSGNSLAEVQNRFRAITGEGRFLGKIAKGMGEAQGE